MRALADMYVQQPEGCRCLKRFYYEPGAVEISQGISG